jgi:hypothetical protein
MQASVSSTTSLPCVINERSLITARHLLNSVMASLSWGLGFLAAWACSSIVIGAILFAVVGVV